MKKEQLRVIYKDKRKIISDHDIEKFNDLILINFQKINLDFIQCVHTYLPSLKLCEPDTAPIIRFLEFKNPGLKVAVPRIDIHSGEMYHIHFDDASPMISNAFGINEPAGGAMIPENEIDLVLIPLLAFDQNGFRVGYGKGYYDRFLARCRKDVFKIGLSFFEPVDEIEDIDQFDIALNYCVTPEKLYMF
jgi:5-formyltetrahydrofolate cyclo-ligase